VREPCDKFSHRTRSKVDHIDQNFGERSRSNFQAICNSTNKVVSISLYEAITSQGKGDLKCGSTVRT
jgi:hypothetical protein